MGTRPENLIGQECAYCVADRRAKLQHPRDEPTVCAKHGTHCEQCHTAERPEATKPTNPKDRAATSRIDLSLFPDTAVVYGALAMTEGDAKYGGYNYRVGGVLASVYYAALRRHMAKWFNGEECDPVTKVPHLANALGCLAVLVDATVAGVLKDDRPPRVPVAELIGSMEANVKHLHELHANGPARCTETENGKGREQ